MGVSNLQGTPWHVEQVHRKEGDDRRHKSRCLFYNPITKQCKDRWKCNGSRYCWDYEPLSEEDFRQRQEDTAEIKRLLERGYNEKEIATLIEQKKKQKEDAKKNTGPVKDTELKPELQKNVSPAKAKTSVKALPNLKGKHIIHKGYGDGFVIEQAGDNIWVDYNGVQKSQKLSFLVKNKLIEY